eukprot:scaffold38143_cov57-Phaeocystis_antarctica.AAC.3
MHVLIPRRAVTARAYGPPAQPRHVTCTSHAARCARRSCSAAADTSRSPSPDASGKTRGGARNDHMAVRVAASRATGELAPRASARWTPMCCGSRHRSARSCCG